MSGHSKAYLSKCQVSLSISGLGLVGFGRIDTLRPAGLPVVGVAILAMALVPVLRLRFLGAVVLLAGLRGGRVGRQPVEVLGHGRTGQAANQKGAGNDQKAEVAKAVEEGCHQVTTPYQRSVCHAGVAAINICAVGRLRSLVIACVAVAAVGACGPFCLSGKVTLSNATVDASYKCPNPANDLAYTVHGSVDLDNSTSKDLTIKSMSEAGTLVDVHGAWSIGSVGQKYDATIDTFSPKSVKSGNKATHQVHHSLQLHELRAGPEHLRRLRAEDLDRQQRGHLHHRHRQAPPGHHLTMSPMEGGAMPKPSEQAKAAFTKLVPGRADGDPATDVR